MTEPEKTEHGAEPYEEPARELKPEDQARVDEFLKKGVNSVERKPFRPLYLMLMLIAVVTVLSLFSQWLAKTAGVH